MSESGAGWAVGVLKLPSLYMARTGEALAFPRVEHADEIAAIGFAAAWYGQERFHVSDRPVVARGCRLRDGRRHWDRRRRLVT